MIDPFQRPVDALDSKTIHNALAYVHAHQKKIGAKTALNEAARFFRLSPIERDVLVRALNLKE